ncbi:hypothetical protein CTRI78_v006817 [Colletotrichum trifolii]|uniref:Clr5 domain-containing protein n=1 Tax=Colletotrichum trifolii TaxID=5466 RepID=A0A4V3HVV0_COLTR|nr:hypothetical protein CTRI78_v006817 [Colletotrichum trifolii]
MSKQKSSTASYAQRWEDLRPTIIDAYLGLNNFDKPKTLSQLELFMKETHSFYAVIHQYQTKFREWGISKRTTKKQKNDMTMVLGKRNREGASTSDVLILMGEDNEVTTRVDKRQMTRYLKGCMRREINTFLTPGVFSRWNLPYLAYKNSLRGVPPNHASPFAGSAPTPEYLNVHKVEGFHLHFPFQQDFEDENAWERGSTTESDSLSDNIHECDLRLAHEDLEIPHKKKDFGKLWAAIQAELLTYRKLGDSDPVISENFQLSSLEKWLQGDTDDFETPLVQDSMMREYASCGWFTDNESIFSSTASTVSARYFMNMDVWNRASFVPISTPRHSSWDFVY